MPNRRLKQDEIEKLNKLQQTTVTALDKLAGDDPELLFALRRRLFTRLMHLERGTPAQRTKLKAEKWRAQLGLCAICKNTMEHKGSELDRFVAWKGYTSDNTRLLHHKCHVDDQRNKGFTDIEADMVFRIDELDEIAEGLDTCETKESGRWVAVSADDAVDRRSGPLRCSSCHGPVLAHKLSKNGTKAHFEHLKAHDGCPLKSGFLGTATPHPDALE